MAGIPVPPPPRPRVWEIPNLKDDTKYFVDESALVDSIPVRLLDTLTSYSYGPRRAQIARFLRQHVDFGDDDSWQPHRLLGKGAFGTAGVWVKRDPADNIIDEVVVKEQKESDQNDNMAVRYSEPGFGPFRGLLTEAVMYRQLNEYRCENILHMRGYAFTRTPALLAAQAHRFYDAIPPPNGRQRRRIRGHDFPGDAGHDKYRFYLEFAPHRSLGELIQRYRAWYQLLLEPFLWHVFDSLAAALEILAKGHKERFSSRYYGDNRTRHWPPKWGVIHFDIKPQNIFLGYPTWKDDTINIATGGSAILEYPMVKLADFGLATVSGPQDPDNVRRNAWKQCPGYSAPEQLFWGIRWNDPVNHNPHLQRATAPVQNLIEREADDPGFYFGNATNAWAVGKVMHELMTLSRPLDLDRIEAPDSPTYRANGRHLLHPLEWSQLPYMQAMGEQNFPQPYPYSQELLDLVIECLRPLIVIDMRDVFTSVSFAQELKLDLLEPSKTPSWYQTRGFNDCIGENPHDALRMADISNKVGSILRSWCSTRTNNINLLPQGPYRFQKVQEEYGPLYSRLYADFSWPTLRPPPAKWHAEINNFGLRLAPYPHNYQINNGRIWFNSPPQGQPGPAAGGGGGGGGDDGGSGRGGGHGAPGGGGEEGDNGGGNGSNSSDTDSSDGDDDDDDDDAIYEERTRPSGMAKESDKAKMGVRKRTLTQKPRSTSKRLKRSKK